MRYSVIFYQPEPPVQLFDPFYEMFGEGFEGDYHGANLLERVSHFLWANCIPFTAANADDEHVNFIVQTDSHISAATLFNQFTGECHMMVVKP